VDSTEFNQQVFPTLGNPTKMPLAGGGGNIPGLGKGIAGVLRTKILGGTCGGVGGRLEGSLGGGVGVGVGIGLKKLGFRRNWIWSCLILCRLINEEARAKATGVKSPMEQRKAAVEIK